MRALLSLATMALLFWAGSLAWFIQSLPSQSTPPSEKTDAIIVLTGGADRVERGFEMLADGAAPILFISGVGEHVTPAQMLAAHAPAKMRMQIVATQPEIIFDYVANTTQTNAQQSKAFIAKRQLKSIRLITAHYHMPRSLMEFHRAMPGVRIVPDAVFPTGFTRAEWWKQDYTRRLMFTEYYKYYGAMLR